MHSGAVTASGKLYMWGDNRDCRLFLKVRYYKKSGRTRNYAFPIEVMDDLKIQFKSVSCGTQHSIAVTEEGEAFSAGSNEFGQLGVKPFDFVPERNKEPYIKIGLFNYKCACEQAIASDGFSIFLSTVGDVYTCGKGNFGRLGHGHEMNVYALTKINWFASNGIRIK